MDLLRLSPRPLSEPVSGGRQTVDSFRVAG